MLFFYLDTICYDDACHLKRFAENPKRSELTEVAKLIASRNIVCDKFHFRNHVDKWCQKNCNPYECSDLEVCVVKFERPRLYISRVGNQSLFC